MDTIFEFLCGTGAGDAPAGERKKLLIIGGSFGGLVTLRCLKKNGGTKLLDVTLVDAQDYWDYCLASPRCLVDPSQFEAQQFGMPLEGICDHLGATFKQGKVETLTKESATLAGGDVVPFDYCVVATGGSYGAGALWTARPDELTAAARKAGFEAEHEALETCSNVVVAGAGLVGCEIAGEIKAAYPDKNVTLIGNELCPSITRAQAARRAKALEKLGVVVKEGAGRITTEPADGKITTDKGTTVDCDKLYAATGFKFDPAFAKDLLVQDDRGRIKTRGSLQAEGVDNVFVAGDVVAVPSGKVAHIAGGQFAEATCPIVAANLKSLATGSTKLKTYEWPSGPGPVGPFGTNMGRKVCVLDGIPIPAFLRDKMGVAFKNETFWLDTGFDVKGLGRGTTWGK